MAGVGRRTLYRKSVTDEYLNSTPEPAENEEIALVQAPRGSNIIEIVLASGEQALALLPTRFRKLIWVKRGDYLIASTSAGDFETCAGETGKVRHRVEHILNKDQIKHIKKRGLWPDAKAFGGCASVSEPNSRDSQPDETNSELKSGDKIDETECSTSSRKAGDVTKNAIPSDQHGDIKGNESPRGMVGNTVSKRGGTHSGDQEGLCIDSDEDDMSDLFVNNNRVAMMELRTDHDDEDSESDESDGDDN